MSEFGYDELQRGALAFVLETETWPMFLEWLRAGATVSTAVEAWLETADLAATRRRWAARSPDPDIRAEAY